MAPPHSWPAATRGTPVYDLMVIGGGIVGLATAYRATVRKPGARVVVLEKEDRLAAHQTGRNSGVVHSGVYYKPGSLKARYCVEGRLWLEDFCRRHGTPYERCGKVIVAVDHGDRPALEELARRGAANGVPCEVVEAARLRELEPHAAGVAALHVPATGIVDYVRMAGQLAELVRQAGGEVVLGARVTALRTGGDGVVADTGRGAFGARYAASCAGLHSDRVAAMAGRRPAAQIVPFRGEYFELTREAQRLVRNLIYPTPDPRFPFLGVHFTRMIGGGVECGPNAVLAFAREGYTKTSLRVADLAEALGSRGLRRLMRRHWRMGLGEMYRSINRGAFVRALRRLVPEIQASHLRPIEAGVRAQAVLPTGELVDDFLIESSDRVLNVINAPSPAATAALRIGDHLAEQLCARLA